MTRDLAVYSKFQVFLNYPFEPAYRPFGDALAFGVAAAGLLPLSALDYSSPDTLRLSRLVEAISSSAYSVHDLSRSQGEGPDNYARMNMPVEMGMALFHAMNTQYQEHRCAFVVPQAHGYQKFASDLAGLDPLVYEDSAPQLVTLTFEWLQRVVPRQWLSVQAASLVAEAYAEFEAACASLAALNGGHPGHSEAREVMYRVCGLRGWWDWRETRSGREQFPSVPLHWAETPAGLGMEIDSHAR